SAAYRRKSVKGHPLLETGKEALKLGRVPPEIIKDLEEYMRFVEMCTAKHNIEAGDKNLALSLLRRNDIKLAYKKLLISTMFLTAIENNFSAFSQFMVKK
ncbi:MAG: hypothetical protein GX152_05890, partial [Methanosarcina sp.]|nr:hypothetical protein [Methanosarcina sp.]